MYLSWHHREHRQRLPTSQRVLQLLTTPLQVLPTLPGVHRRIFSGFTLPMPANELTESQPVKACSPSKALHTWRPIAETTFPMSIYLAICCEMQCWKSGTLTSFEKARQRMRTSVSSDEMTMALNGSFFACLAWRRRRVSASSWSDCSSSSSCALSVVSL